MAKRKNNRNRYDADTHNDAAALLAKAARRKSFENGSDGWNSGRAGVHGETRGRRKDRRENSRAALRKEWS